MEKPQKNLFISGVIDFFKVMIWPVKNENEDKVGCAGKCMMVYRIVW